MVSAIRALFDWIKQVWDSVIEFFEEVSEWLASIGSFVLAIIDKLHEWILTLFDVISTWSSYVVDSLEGLGINGVVLTLCITATAIWIITRIGGKE